MAAKARYTKEDIDLFVQMKKEGKTSEQIARITGFSASGIRHAIIKRNEETQMAQREPLESYTPRELIKYLHNLGYRIKDNSLIVEQKVNIRSIIEE